MGARIFSHPVYYATRGGHWTLYGTYFVTHYDCGKVDWSEVDGVKKALKQGGYYSYVGRGKFWRRTHNG